MEKIDPKTEEDIFKYLTENLHELLKPKFSEVVETRPGVTCYDVVDKFGSISADEAREYLSNLQKKGKLHVNSKSEGGLKFYLPGKKK